MIYAATTRLVEAALRLRVALGGQADLRQRLAIGAPPARCRIWFHGASVGELQSGQEIILELARRLPVLVTANTETGRDLAAGWGLSARLAPLDSPAALSRFLDAARPGLLVTLENEFWPLRSRMLAQRGIAQAMIGARMSARSAATWRRLPGIIGPMLTRLAALSAQDAASEARLCDLGLDPACLLPRLDLKLLAPARITPPPDNRRRDRTILAASTHEGEEATILDAWIAARRAHPDLRLILAIRHPRRGDEVAALIAARGLPVARVSRGAATAPLLLADTLGEMPRWYDQAGICIVGGSLADRGGHTPWEPAAHRCAIVHGPHVANFTESYGALHAQDAALAVTSTSLPAQIIGLAGDGARARALGRAARAVLEAEARDPSALIDRLANLAQDRADHDIARMSKTEPR